jgi:hypothetical protein
MYMLLFATQRSLQHIWARRIHQHFFSFKYDGDSKTQSVNRGRDANDVTVCQGVEEDRALATTIKQWALISNDGSWHQS